MHALAPNRVLKKLRNNEVVLSVSLTPICSGKIAELLGLLGFDCLWIDMEHQDFSYDQVFEACLGSRASGMEPMVRIRREGRHSCFRAFEAGATGIMVPHCMSAADARAIVRDARFAPLGLRGMDGVEPAAAYGLVGAKQYHEWANGETFVLLQIEDREAVEDVEAIAATPGIDVLFAGPGDLSQSYGHPGEVDHPLVMAAIERVAAAAAQAGIAWGAPGISPERARGLIGQGARFINTTSLSGVMRKGFKESLEAYRAVLPQAATDAAGV
ncbi:MAG: aldolase [Acidobacteria bacterium]|nr:aldolase [Acidobacteriota bacterium]